MAIHTSVLLLIFILALEMKADLDLFNAHLYPLYDSF